MLRSANYLTIIYKTVKEKKFKIFKKHYYVTTKVLNAYLFFLRDYYFPDIHNINLMNDFNMYFFIFFILITFSILLQY